MSLEGHIQTLKGSCKYDFFNRIYLLDVALSFRFHLASLGEFSNNLGSREMISV